MKDVQNIIDNVRKKCIDPNCVTQIGLNPVDKTKAVLCVNCYMAVINLDQEELLEMYDNFTKTIYEKDYRELVFTILSTEEAMGLLHHILTVVLTDDQHDILDLTIKSLIKDDYFDLVNELMINVLPIKK